MQQKKKPLCNAAVCQHVIVVIKVPDFHGSLIYWFVNLPGWFRLDVVKTSCCHHKAVARPPRETRKPPSLGVVTDKGDDAVRTEPQVSWCPLVLLYSPPSLCFAEQGEEQGAAWPESGRVSKGRGLGRQDCRRWEWEEGDGLNGMEKSLWERVETHMALRWVLGWTVGVKNAGIFPFPPTVISHVFLPRSHQING